MEQQETINADHNQPNTEKELADVRVQCEEYLNGWKRAKADFINYQKEEGKRFEQFAQFANELLIKDLLMTLDSCNLALHAHPDQKGFVIVRGQLEDILRKHGLEKIAVAPGETFNHALHESIESVEATPAAPSGHIAEEIESGYTIHGKVIRPARVKIAR